MKRKSGYFLALLFLPLFIAGRAAAIEIDFSNNHSSIRCAGGKVSVGDTERGVTDKCGEPAAITPGGSNSFNIWVYQVGASKFMYYLGFLNGRLERIVSRPCINNDPNCYDLR